MQDQVNRFDNYPEPPIEAEVSLGGFERIDMPIDWLVEEWAVGLSSAGLGALFRLYAVSLRQSPAGSLPGTVHAIEQIVPRSVGSEELREALELWPMHSDGRRYWARIVPLVEDAWGRKRGKRTKDAMRKTRERLAKKLMELGVSENGAKFGELQDMVLDELPDGARLTTKNVLDAATRAGVLGNVRPVRLDTVGQSSDSPKASGGQSADSHGTVGGQSSDSPLVSGRPPGTTYGAGARL